ncbi:MAG TPA: NAD(P) transhydrogenase subunit alpha [Thalassobaculum sp.]
MAETSLTEQLRALADQARDLAKMASDAASSAGQQVAAAAPPVPGEAVVHGGQLDPSVVGLTVFVLACFVGYYVVWRVTPALHSPLMAVTNAISSVIIVGALIAAGPAQMDFSSIMGFLAVILASVNIFGGFLVTQRMLSMFRKKK